MSATPLSFDYIEYTITADDPTGLQKMEGSIDVPPISFVSYQSNPVDFKYDVEQQVQRVVNQILEEEFKELTGNV